MLINPSIAMKYSRMSSRGVLGEVLTEMEPQLHNLKVLVADTMHSSRLENFAQNAPNKLINVGISEQNMMGIAAGLASEGYNVFTSTYAPFASMRCFEMIRSQIAYMNLNVKIVGILSGLATGPSGNTHYGLEDIALMRTVPNMTILSPADCSESAKALEAAIYHEGPMYIRLTGVNGNTTVYKNDYDFEIGKAIVLEEGTDIAFVATGTLVAEAIRATRALKKLHISTTIVDMHTIKPLDENILNKVFSSHKLVISLEEHSIIGGLGSALAQFKADKVDVAPLVIMGIKNEFLMAGSYHFLMNEHNLTAPRIVEKIKEIMKL